MIARLQDTTLIYKSQSLSYIPEINIEFEIKNIKAFILAPLLPK